LLINFSNLNNEWSYDFALRNYFSRRWALLEIDVIVGMALGMKLEDLIMVYSLQFPKWNEYEDENYYDRKGRLIYTTNSQGLVGVGLDRDIWEGVKGLKEGEVFVHTITKSELYNGHNTTYYAPFEKRDRVEDYKVAWAHFEKIFTPEIKEKETSIKK